MVVYTRADNAGTSTKMTTVTDKIEITAGYFAYQADVVLTEDNVGNDYLLTFSIGNNKPFYSNYNAIVMNNSIVGGKATDVVLYVKQQYGGLLANNSINPLKLNKETGNLPITIVGGSNFYTITVEVLCKPTDKTIEEWQQKAFNTIMNNYERKLQAYDQAVKEVSSGFGFHGGTNPAMYRQTEQQELKRGCLRWLFANDEFSSWANWYNQEASADGGR
jgi:hypothetical protein